MTQGPRVRNCQGLGKGLPDGTGQNGSWGSPGPRSNLVPISRSGRTVRHMAHQVSIQMILLMRYKITSRLSLYGALKRTTCVEVTMCIPGLNSRILKGQQKYLARIKVKVIMSPVQ